MNKTSSEIVIGDVVKYRDGHWENVFGPHRGLILDRDNDGSCIIWWFTYKDDKTLKYTEKQVDTWMEKLM